MNYHTPMYCSSFIGAALALMALTRPPVVDVHAHLDGRAAGRITRILDESGVQHIVNLSGGNFSAGIGAALRLSRALPGRVVHFYNPNWSGIDSPWWAVREAMGLERAVHQYGFRGLKVSKALGLYVRDRAGVLIDVDDPRLDPLWTKAGELGVPISIHTGDPKAFWEPLTPANERYDELKVHPSWSFHGKAVPSREALLAARDRVVARHPLTNFILVHFANNPEDPDYVEHLLAMYPNAFVDISARIPELGRHPAQRMRRLFIRFQDRILFGTDIGIGRRFLMLGSTGTDQPTDADATRFYDTHWRWLESDDRAFQHPTPIQGNWTIDGVGLPDSTLQKIYRENAIRLGLTGTPPRGGSPGAP